MRRLRFAKLPALPALAALVLAACGGAPPPPPAPPPPTTATAPAPPLAPPDPLGPRPAPPAPAPFTPPAPTVYTAPNGMQVWLLERHELPIISATLAVSVGSSADPSGKEGLAFVTANMLDEGAGKYGSIALAKQLELLGAEVSTSASLDFSSVSLSVLKKNLAPAFALFGDVVARPRFDAVEWKRVHDLWENALLQRAREPQAVAPIVAMRALFGDASGYGHPADGYSKSAKSIQLEEARAFYKGAWRPDRATLVVVGDVTRAELDPLVASALGAWKAPATPGLQPRSTAPAATPASPAGAPTRVLVVDRADAPQAVIALIRQELPAADPESPVLTRVNIALGGSFTSRLNQDLREEHGWSYGAHSRVTLLRSSGSLVASAAVQTEHTGEALKALLADVGAFAHQGLTEEEKGKTRLIARADLVDMFERGQSAALRLARDAAEGLGPDYEAKSSVRRDDASPEDLARAAKDFDATGGYVVIVGPRAKIEPQLTGLNVALEARDAEGAPLKAPAPPAAAGPAKPAAPAAPKKP